MQEEFESGIRSMEYPILRGASGDAGLSSPQTGHPGGPEGKPAAREEAFVLQVEAARREGVAQGRQLATAESSAWRQERAAELTTAAEAFRAGRDAYLAEVEKEVVRLALAIAEKILHRESQLDPLLLSGAVRRALGQLPDSTEVRLQVPPEQHELWADVVRLMPGLSLRPQVVADPDLPGCTVVLESSLGSVDLGVRAQLEEIARGFFDRVETRSEGERLPESGAEEAKGSA